MRRSRASLLASALPGMAMFATASIPILAASDAQAQSVDPVLRRCRDTLANTARIYLERVTASRMRCQNRVIRGAIPYVDCLSGASDPKVQGTIQTYTDRLSRALSTACANVNLVFLGFPGSCPDPTGPPFD